MKVRMLTHYMRAADHINVIRYLGGQKYDLPNEEARLFIEIGVAVEDKDMGAAPETKAEGVWVSEPDNHLMFRSEPGRPATAKKRRK